MTTSRGVPPAEQLAPADAGVYAEWFACLAEPMRVRLLHAVAVAGRAVTVGELTEQLGISQSTCSHHVRKLADVGFVHLRKDGTATLVSVNPACCTGLPHAADAVMGMLAPRPCCPEDLPADVFVRALAPGEVPPGDDLGDAGLPGHRWVAEIDGQVVGFAAARAVSTRPAYAGVADTSVCVGDDVRGRGVGTALLHRLVTAADADGLWTLQTSVFPEDRAGLALHRSAGFRTVGLRERIARHGGVWRDTVLLERRRVDDGKPTTDPRA